MLTFIGRYVRDSGEDVCRVCCRSLNAISVVYTALSSFRVDIEPLEIVIKVDRACAKVTSKKGSMCSEDGRYVNMALFGQRKGNTSEPLVEVGDNRPLLLSIDILIPVSRVLQHDFSRCLTSPRNQVTRYPKTTASLVSSSPGGEGIPAVFQRSAFHSSRNPYPVLVSISRIRGAPSISHLPYMRSMPRSFIEAIDAAISGFVGVSSSTSTAAYSQSFSECVSGHGGWTDRSTIEGPNKGVSISVFSGGDGCF